MRVAIVSTSINPRPDSYASWVDAGHLIVAGDVNSPDELAGYVTSLGGTYLTPAQQDLRWRWSSYVGWRCIQRRNTAIATALEAGYDVIVTVDDDNMPLSAVKFVDGHIRQFTSPSPDEHKMYASVTPFLNTGEFCIPPFLQRGVPLDVTSTPTLSTAGRLRAPRVVVSQAQVLGDPDCGAVERICRAPDVKAIATEAIIAPGTYAAFNTQATVWTREWAPVMACLPHLGRYDDIIASYVFARLGRTYDVALHVGTPVVRQDRNAHNLLNDLRAEYWGMRHARALCNRLDEAHISADMPLHVAYSELLFAVRGMLPPDTNSFVNWWVDDWQNNWKEDA